MLIRVFSLLLSHPLNANHFGPCLTTGGAETWNGQVIFSLPLISKVSLPTKQREEWGADISSACLRPLMEIHSL